MKKIILGLFSFLFLALTSVFFILVFRPLWVVNPTNLGRALNKAHILKQWSWKEAQFIHKRYHWNQHGFGGHFKDLCLIYENDTIWLNTCLSEISWELKFSFDWKEGLRTDSLKPLKVLSPFFSLAIKERPTSTSQESSPPDIWGYWQMLWSKKLPELDFKFNKINIKDYQFDFKLKKTSTELDAYALNFHLHGTPKKLILYAPLKYPLPQKLGLGRRIFFRQLKLEANVEKTGIPLVFSGGLEALTINLNSFIALPLKEELTSLSFRKKLLLASKAELILPDVRGNLKKYGPKPLDALPAPLNAMDGLIKVHVGVEDIKAAHSVLIKAATDIALASPKQVLDMSVLSEVAFNVESMRPGDIRLGLNFKKVSLQLPRLSKKSLPPQFFPDSRIKNLSADNKIKKKRTEKKEHLLILKLEAQGDQALHIISNLLDEPLRLNLDLLIENSNIERGHIDFLPFKTKVFKRPIQIPAMRFSFHYPVEPVIKGRVIFPLPEYKITVALEGPVTKPRYAFFSEPPLPLSDIYAVLLFGRPMSELNSEDNTSAQKTNQILSQGILSLSILYFFAGSPVEYVGFDPDSGTTTAQFGLGEKNSLSVGGGEGKVNSAGVRRSLGKGWYIDTSVQNSASLNATQNRTYGILLERILAY